MPLPVTFGTEAAATGGQLDQMFAALGILTPVPCQIAGTNAIVLTPLSIPATPQIASYQPYMQFTGIVLLTNTAGMTAEVGSLPALNVYIDTTSGPVALTGNECISGNAITLIYDPALNVGIGGFHLINSTDFLSIRGGTLTGPLSVPKLTVGASAPSITRILSQLGTLTYTATPANATQDQPIVMAGVGVNDSISVGPPNISGAGFAGVGFSAYVPAAGTVNVRLINASSVSISAASITIRATAMGFT